MFEYYEWLKVFHVISMISWMAGLLYLPRIYVYHTRVTRDSEADNLFQIMERRLIKYIMNPAMISTFIFGILLSYLYGIAALGVWFHIKMLFVTFLAAFHGLLAKWRKDFVNGTNKKSETFFRIANEVPTVFMIVIVIMVIAKPFE
ncbi:MAG: protoporphyrinogen oxidase HemJ [Rickettsiaceae bacterium]|nr:protoporphyrinogen oxidase HemJ [Rickettsiaceae bacterium]